MRLPLFTLLISCATGYASASLLAADTPLLTNTRQLTFDGKRAGEGYFNHDGSLLVFQSERKDSNPFFQIYLMNLEDGDIEAISPGVGKTTCAWIHPDNNRVLFSSTHEDPKAADKQKEEFELRASGKERRYSWDYDEHYDLYAYDRDTNKYTNLTSTKGYDAEASYSPDGEWIVFASNRQAYDGSLDEEGKKKFDVDPAWAIDLYIMKADGTGLRRLTTSPGYDGGPFFSPDGKLICYRHFAENGATAEIMTMNVAEVSKQPVAGTPKQLTKLNAMSWAPYYHPSGKYLIFTTNLHGFNNFELYIVDAEGKKAPIRATETEGFDGLPVFSPKGDQLVWTSNRTTGQKSQLFIADWNHEAALQKLGLISTETAFEDVDAAVEDNKKANRAEILPVDIARHVEFLCRPDLAGRLTGTEGERKATAYVASYFEDLGFKPEGGKDSYFQEFEFTAGIDLGPKNHLEITGPEKDAGKATLEVKKDWRPVSFSKSGELPESKGVVFAGYGLVVPKADGQEEYDSYVHLDVKDKWVVMFRFLPEDVTPERRQQLARYAGLRYKAMTARDLGAAGIIIVSGPTSKAKSQLVPLDSDGSFTGGSIPLLSITDDVATQLLKSAGKDIATLQKKLDNGDLAMGFELPGVQITGSVDLVQEKRKGRNVLGRLQVGEQPTTTFVLVGAHIDHLGKGRSSSSLAKDDESNLIHFGADDNASGVGGMLEIAEYLADQQAKGKLNSKHDIVFAAWSGEELGLLGAHHYIDAHGKDIMNAAHSGLIGLDFERAIVAAFNLDMIGRMTDNLVLQGIGSSPIWRSEIEQRNVPVGLNLTLQDDCYLPTDASVFYMDGVPILSAFTGSHEDYHTPRDTPEKLNYDGAVKISKLMALITKSVAQKQELPAYTEQAKPQDQVRANLRAYLGTIPDYAAEVTGVQLSGVTKGAPADTAGLKQGDIITELAGKKIDNIYDYTYAIEALKIGEQVTAKIKRGSELLELKITPGSRD
jgi:Tol biopolymer transport system component